MHLLAVTGTDGKTSTAGFARALLHGAGVAAASLTSQGLTTPWQHQPDPVLPPGAAAQRELVEDLEAQGVEALVVEAHSRALARGVLDGLAFDVAVFTGLTPDHLDAHGDLARYTAAKHHLFQALVRPAGHVVIAHDAPGHAGILELCERRGLAATTYGTAVGADLRLRVGPRTAVGRSLSVRLDGRREVLKVGLRDLPLIVNAVGALAAVTRLGHPPGPVLDALTQLRAPAGRFERVPGPPGVEVVVDQAHTPAALEIALRELRPPPPGRTWLVIGCGGDRDPRRRAAIGAVAGRLADVVVVTDDNPRHEDPAAIRRAVLAACPQGREVAGRARAVATALGEARRGDVVVVAGRGDERFQEIGATRHPCRDTELVARALRAGEEARGRAGVPALR